MKDWKKKLSVLITEGLYEQVTDDKGKRVLGYVNCSDKVMKELDTLISQEIEKAREEGKREALGEVIKMAKHMAKNYYSGNTQLYIDVRNIKDMLSKLKQ